ncbi:MAG TPA: MFS transporter [Desulfotignum sp.]|nr:MFS transporter [Desulfotignum sp.]
MTTTGTGPFDIPNIRWFIAFRIFFNSRFYYPVFTILFLDFGLTVAQFSVLNAVWAATIVLAEVPSGAFADVIGRKRLLNFAAGVMIFEIGIISFMPRIDPKVIFAVFLVNRMLSGLAEAAASGADEALAYDSLTRAGMADQWGLVLERLMRYQALGFVVAMTTGAAVYDPKLMGQAADFLGFGIVLTQDITMRFPLYLTFVLALLAFFSTLKMTEVEASPADKETGNLKQTLAMTFAAGAWIVQTPFVFAVMLFGMLFDGVIRMVITLSSQYYRMIEIPESIFGLMGSGVALLGMVIPKIARQIAENRSPVQALFVTALLAGAGLVSMNFFWPWIGLVPALLTFSAMYFTGFFVSFYVNREADSRQRATVLSFKGLSYNISYGVLGILYALVLKLAKAGLDPVADLSSETMENLVFVETFFWFPLFFIAGFMVLGAVCACFFNRFKRQERR